MSERDLLFSFVRKWRNYIAAGLMAGWGAGIALCTERWGVAWLLYTLAFSAFCLVLGRWVRSGE